ncbi:MAG: glycosyltransferase family 9 protein, partial [Ardenticatenales bacterium]|nr:glycosyltransferase family 9 protein [Ardenticatenales bacterium]
MVRHTARSLLIRGVVSLLQRHRAELSSEPKRILLIRPDHLGDVLFLTPALHALRQGRPDARLTALVGPWATGVLTNNPDLDEVETLPFPWFDRQPKVGALDPY